MVSFLFTGIKVIGQWNADLCDFVTTTEDHLDFLIST